ncbi:MAG: O-antigen ligase family protein, partial [Armatimonadota bacterium]
MAARTLENIARALVVLVAVSAPWLLGYFPGARGHWLDGVLPLLAQYGAPLMVLQIAIIVAAGCWVAAGRVGGSPRRPPRATDVAAVALLGLMAISTLTSVYRHASVVELHRILGCFLLFVLVRAMAGDERHRHWLCVALIASCSCVALFGLRHYVKTAVLLGDPSWREFGTFGNPNSFAGLLAMAIPLSAGLAIRARSTAGRMLLGTGLAVMVVVLFATGSKGAMLALLLALMFFVAVVVWPATGSSRARKAVVLAAAAAPIALALVLPPMRARITTAFTTQSHSGAFRYYTWKGTARMIAARPWLGFGPGTFASAYPRYTEVGFSRMAHNKDLQVAAECGVPAAAALAALFFAYFIAVGRRVVALGRQEEPPSYGERALLVGCAASVGAFGLHCLVDYDWYIPALALTVWFLMGLGLADPEPAGSGSSASGQLPRRTGGARGPWRRVALWVVVAGSMVVLCHFPVRVLTAAALLQRARAAAAGDVYAAQDELRRAIAVTPGDAGLHAQMASFLRVMGQGGASEASWRAVAELKEAAALQPTEPTHRYQLARVYGELDEGEQAIAAAQHARSLSPCDTGALLQLARLYERAGRFDDAHAMYVEIDELWHSPVGRHQAIEGYANLDYAYAWLHLAQLAEEAGDAAGVAAAKGLALVLLDDYRRWSAQQAEMARAGANVRPPDTEAA